MRSLPILVFSYLTLCNASIFAREAEPRMWAGPKNVIEKTVEDGKLIFAVASVGSAKAKHSERALKSGSEPKQHNPNRLDD